MQSKTLYLLLALSVMVAVVTALEEDDELFDEMVENYMEKRKGRRGKGKTKTACKLSNLYQFTNNRKPSKQRFRERTTDQLPSNMIIVWGD